MKNPHLVALAKTIIAASFPVLRGMTIELKVIDTDDYVMAVSLEGKVIHLDISREDASRMGRRVLTGVLAHELCHVEEDFSHGPFLERLFSWLCQRMPNLETRMERRIDAMVIEKGYGNELLAFQRYHDQHYEPYDQTDGLTVEEIERALLNLPEPSLAGTNPPLIDLKTSKTTAINETIYLGRQSRGRDRRGSRDRTRHRRALHPGGRQSSNR